MTSCSAALELGSFIEEAMARTLRRGKRGGAECIAVLALGVPKSLFSALQIPVWDRLILC
ncbi:MAG: hypothetical protein V2J51_17675, partial [Erythrobacter sp.]|nr:hypothetical protein [Erythrobacter sp.]